MMVREPSSASEVLLSISSGETEASGSSEPLQDLPGSLPHSPILHLSPGLLGGLRQPASAQVHLDPFNLFLVLIELGRGKMDGRGFISAALLAHKPAGCWRRAAGSVGGFGGLGRGSLYLPGRGLGCGGQRWEFASEHEFRRGSGEGC